MSDALDMLYGNESLKAYLKDKISSRTLPHALIFEGPEGSGKTTAAFALAAELNPDYSDKILRHLSADVRVLQTENDKKSIGVSAVREIKRNAFIKPQELQNRIFILKTAHLLTAEAQNALLKILEEPPSGVYFFLLTENSSLLLPTVVSRAPLVKMSLFSDEETADIVLRLSEKASALRKTSPDDFEQAIRFSAGSIGKALALIESPDSENAKIRSDVLSFLEILRDGKNDKILLFFLHSAYKREQLESFIMNLKAAIRDMLKAKYGSYMRPVFFGDEETAAGFSSEFAKKTLLNISFAAEKASDTIQYNVNIESFTVAVADLFYRAVRQNSGN